MIALEYAGVVAHQARRALDGFRNAEGPVENAQDHEDDEELAPGHRDARAGRGNARQRDGGAAQQDTVGTGHEGSDLGQQGHGRGKEILRQSRATKGQQGEQSRQAHVLSVVFQI